MCVAFVLCTSDVLYEVFDHSLPMPVRAKHGLYLVKLSKGHDWHYVIVDDRFPHKSNGTLAFASCEQPSEIWVPVLEKAFAKLHGSYESLISGQRRDGRHSACLC